MRRRTPGTGGPWALAAALLYVGLRLAGGAFVAIVEAPHGAGAAPVTVFIPRGATAREVAAVLAGAGVIREARWLPWWLWLRGESGRVQAGEYRFAGPRSLRQVAEALVQGRVALWPVTIPEGATRWEVAEALAAVGLGSLEEAVAATERVELIADLDGSASSLEGYLFPDTYLVPRSAAPGDVVAMMVDRFRTAWTAERRARAARLGMSVRQVVTLASMVEAETGRPHERPLVAAVFHNRMRRGMLLQCDPTLLYALRLAGRRDRNIRRADFDLDSPYNTYRYPGLPPGPIGNPGDASLDAALQPAQVDYLYFVGRNDGSHAFSRTLREHERLVDRYQRRRTARP